ncbi:MAG: hypothetical protein Q9225_008028, partial [Loekoesia sp. 1 TL-2023]
GTTSPPLAGLPPNPPSPSSAPAFPLSAPSSPASSGALPTIQNPQPLPLTTTTIASHPGAAASESKPRAAAAAHKEVSIAYTNSHLPKMEMGKRGSGRKPGVDEEAGSEQDVPLGRIRAKTEVVLT